MKFSKSDYKILDRIECDLRELSKHYGYLELSSIFHLYMKFMREVELDANPTPKIKESA